MELDLDIFKDKFKNYRDKEYRQGQKDALEKTFQSKKKVVILQLPTGAGKSLLGMSCLAANKGGIYIVHSKTLQNQITSDFPEAKSLFGRKNYRCLLDMKRNCDDCIHTERTPCTFKNDCIYERKKKQVLEADYKILNYDYFLSESNFIGRFGNQNIIVVDEADNLENTLVNFITISFSNYIINKLDLKLEAEELKMSSVNQEELVKSWIDFAENAFAAAKKELYFIDVEIENLPKNVNEDNALYLSRERKSMVRLLEKLTILINNIDKDWVLDKQDNGQLIFKPLWITPEITELFFWGHGAKFVLMSASFPPPKIIAKCLGIDVDDIDYYVFPSLFPAKNRPVYCHSVANLTSKTSEIEIPKLVHKINKIMNCRPNVKGIIHAVSYKLANRIMNDIGGDRLITHNPMNKQNILTEFMESKDPLVLISPSIERGLSLHDDLCRFAIIAKAPYLFLGDKIVSKRLYSNRVLGGDWYKSNMLLTVLQMAGRGVRHKDDFAETFILDEQIKKAITERPAFLPSWFLDSIIFNLPDDIKYS